MGDLLKNFVNEELQGQIQKNYPYLRYPACVYAEVIRVKEKQGIYTTVLKILDKNKSKDSRFPEIPNVKTEIPVKTGDIVVSVLLYGECDLFIVGRCVGCS